MYKIIRSAQMPKFKEISQNDDNLIDTATKDAEEWASHKSEEIELLKKQEIFRKEYIGNVAHELKTPIFTIQGYVSTLLDGGLEDETINRKYLERTDKVIQRMTSIVHDLDAINRLESGELKMEYTTFNIADLVNEIFETQEYLAKERNVTLTMEIPTVKSLMMVYADKMRISMAISNLVINAIKYNKPDGGSVRIRFYDMDNRFLVEVSDTGIGIPQEHLDRIFERFFRVDKSRSREQGGTGLGLAIVKHVIEAHGESLNVKSTLNKGTSFSFTIKKGNIK
ncbi:MAG: ATP-binding protein [Bacteroidales bacterium]|nr:ATP-binding protein [Bacteroidales bacterium]